MKKLLFLLLPLTAALSAFGQTQPPVENTFRLLSLEGFVTDIAYDVTPTKKIKVFASQSDFSPNYKTPKAGTPITFYKEIPNPDPTSPLKTIKQTLAVADPGATTGRIIILISPARAGSAAPFECICVPDSYERHKLETAALYNFSQKRVAVKIEDHITELAPGKSDITPYPSGKHVGLTFSVAVNKPDGWDAVMSTFTAAAPNARVFAFVKDIANPSTAEGASPVVIRFVFDTQQPPETPAAKP